MHNLSKLLFLPFYLIALGCGSDPEIHIILPEGFKGEATVVCDEVSGIPIKESDSGIITLEIPTNGILITQLPMSCKIDKRKYFYKNAEGAVTEIPKMSELEEIRSWTRKIGAADPEREIIGAYEEMCGFKTDNGFNTQSVTIMTYNELQDSLASPFFAIRNHLNIQKELKKCQESKR